MDRSPRYLSEGYRQQRGTNSGVDVFGSDFSAYDKRDGDGPRRRHPRRTYPPANQDPFSGVGLRHRLCGRDDHRQRKQRRNQEARRP